jgi:hypothetical protein
MSRGGAAGIAISIGLALLLMAAWLSNRTREPPALPKFGEPVEHTARQPGWHKITVPVALACHERADFERLTRIRVSGDQVALQKALAVAVYGNFCTALHAGDEVSLEDTAILSGVVQVRRRGETLPYWTDLAFID